MKPLSTMFNFFLTSSAILFVNRPLEQAVVVVSPPGNQVVRQPAGSTLSVNSLNGQLTVSAAQGEDISEEVNTALGLAAGTCGTVNIAPGSYTWGNANIKMLPCQTLQGVGATILVTVAGTDPFLIVKGPTPPDPPTNHTYTEGSIRGITFVGPFAPTSQTTSTGIELGGKTSAETAQLFNFYDVHIRNFGCGVKVDWAFQIAFFGGSIEYNYDGVCFADIVTFLENFNFHGTQILANINYGINADQTGVNVQLYLTDCSIDYNGQNRNSGGQIQITNGKLSIIGGHLENTGLPMITVREPQAPAIVNVYVAGTAFNVVDTNPSHTYASFIGVKGFNDVIEIGRGVSFYSQGSRVSAATDWTPITNQNSRLLMDPYTFMIGTVPQGLPAFIGTAPNNYSYPTYDVHDNVTGMVSSFPYPR